MPFIPYQSGWVIHPIEPIGFLPRALPLKKLFQKTPRILSPRVVVRTHLSWPYRIMLTVVCCLLLLSLSWGMYEAGRYSVQPQHVWNEEKMVLDYDAATCRQNKKQQLCTQMGDLIHQIQISTTANENLGKQIKSLAHENDSLKEKLVFFQHLMAGNTKSGISIHQFNVKETETPGKYRYALTLIQGGERPSDFKGNLKFHVTLQQNNQSKTIPLISSTSQENFPINFKFLHRLDESFKVPTDAIVESLQVQIYEQNDNKKVILTQTTQPAP